MAEFRSGNYPVTFHLVQDGRRCTLVVQRATLLRPALEDVLVAPTLTDRLSREAVVVLEGVEPR